jgi:hypothetical protein
VANGEAERDTALIMLEQLPGQRRLTITFFGTKVLPMLLPQIQ